MSEAPEAVRLAITYPSNHVQRMKYAVFTEDDTDVNPTSFSIAGTNTGVAELDKSFVHPGNRNF